MVGGGAGPRGGGGKARVRQEASAMLEERNVPEIFCFTFAMRTSRSTNILRGQMGPKSGVFQTNVLTNGGANKKAASLVEKRGLYWLPGRLNASRSRTPSLRSVAGFPRLSLFNGRRGPDYINVIF